MKKPVWILARVGGGLVGVVALAAVLCLDRVDHRPYFREPYYAETAARLEARTATNAVGVGELSAGFGQARLTPTVNASTDDPATGRFRALPLAGFGNRQGRPATGVHDDLFVKAVALRVEGRLGVMVGVDALIVPREVTDLAVAQLARELSLRREQIYLSATHTHCSLGGWAEKLVGKAFAGDFQPGARAWFAACIVAAVREAVADLKPASIGQGSLAAPEFVRNRLVGALGLVDPEFSFVVVRQAEGRQAVLGSYSAHATVLSGDMMEFSGDYPGCWQREVEKATGGMAVFLAGGVGSHGPNAGERGLQGVEKMGQALAQKVMAGVAATALTNRIAFGLFGLEVDLPELQARVSDGVRLRPWLTARLMPVVEDCFLQAFRLGEVVWISTPCDFSGEMALGIKDLLRAKGYRAVVTSFNGDYIGYVIPGRYYHMGGYEPQVMSFYGPGVPDYLDGLIRSMALALTRRE